MAILNSRSESFEVEPGACVRVHQNVDIFSEPPKWERPSINWFGTDTYDLERAARFQRAMTKALKLAHLWAQDTGKIAEDGEK
jgi:hypothetical protein